MLSDKGSNVSREFGILNTNIPEGHPFHGIPFPVDYLIGPDAKIQSKYSLPEYTTRIASSQILLQEFGNIASGDTAVLKSEDIQAQIRLSTNHAAVGQEIGVSADFTLAPGWHVYGKPLPENYTPTTLTFDNAAVAKQSIDFPPPQKVRFEALNETLPVYSGKFTAKGK